MGFSVALSKDTTKPHWLFLISSACGQSNFAWILTRLLSNPPFSRIWLSWKMSIRRPRVFLKSTKRRSCNAVKRARLTKITAIVAANILISRTNQSSRSSSARLLSRLTRYSCWLWWRSTQTLCSPAAPYWSNSRTSRSLLVLLHTSSLSSTSTSQTQKRPRREPSSLLPRSAWQVWLRLIRTKSRPRPMKSTITP